MHKERRGSLFLGESQTTIYPYNIRFAIHTIMPAYYYNRVDYDSRMYTFYIGTLHNN